MKLRPIIASLALVAGSLTVGLVGASRPVAAAASTPCGVTTVAPTYKHVVVIPMENTSYGSIIGSSSAPYINSLASGCGLATNYTGLTHYSLPNYVGMTSGLSVSALSPFYNDCLPGSGCTSSAPSIFGQVTSKSTPSV